jgi:peptide-methionine (S)-S-oxide reductase
MRTPLPIAGAFGFGRSALIVLFLLGIHAMSDPQQPRAAAQDPHPVAAASEPGKTLEKATFAAGCFWCTEAVFQRLAGVQSVVSGYSGGHVPHPTYEQVCTGATGHAEAVEITFDPRQLSYAELLKVFWKTHDPTTLNRQGNDHGTQYRSAIFYHNDQQRKLAEESKQRLDASGALAGPIVTQIVPYKEFFPAEDYHRDYFKLHGRQPYCQTVIRPKVEKFEKAFGDKLKDPPKEK